ncbi:MAG: TauD/TfdA dioxygenase family protein [Gammaproteobacteria bacterium]
MSLEIRRLEPFGAEILGLDLERPFDEPTADRIRRAWIESGIVLVRGGVRSEQAHLRLSRCFGELEPSATKDLNVGDQGYLLSLRYDAGAEPQERLNVFEVGGERRTGWLGWHWDQTFMPEIVRGAVLRAVDPARSGGETGFIDGIAAYERLPESLRRRIDGLEVVYWFTGAQEMNPFGYPKDLRLVARSQAMSQNIARQREGFPPCVHPLVITQRETGRKVLKLSPMHCQYILGMPREESDALLHELAAWIVDERFAYVHRWEKNDAIAWDNWRVVHKAFGVAPEVSRNMQRTTIVGDYKVGRYLDPSLDRARFTARIVD